MRFWYHVGIQSCHILRSSAWHGQDFLDAIVEISRFEMVWHSWKFRSTPVDEIRIYFLQMANCLTEICAVSIVQDDNAKTVLRIINFAGRACRVKHKINILSTACYENVNRWHVIPDEAQLGTITPLENEYRPK